MLKFVLKKSEKGQQKHFFIMLQIINCIKPSNTQNSDYRYSFKI